MQMLCSNRNVGGRSSGRYSAIATHRDVLECTPLLRTRASRALVSPRAALADSFLGLFRRGGSEGGNGSTSSLSPAPKVVVSAKDVIIKYYDAYNRGDIKTIETLLAEDCSYHDMIYEEPFVGRAEVVKYLTKVFNMLPKDLKFVMEDVTEGDSRKVGIMWHVECGDGIPFPFSRGCSFYTLNDQGQIVQARDLVESPTKPGTASLSALGAITPIIRALGPASNPSRAPLGAAALWAFYAAYTAYIMLGTSAPGAPAWQTPPEVLEQVLNLSLNFFYVNIGLDAIGAHLVPCVADHPVYEALFNAINAWSLMCVPLLLSDGRAAKVANRPAWAAGVMFLTNVFFIPFMALRAAPEPEPPGAPPPAAFVSARKPPPSDALPAWAPAIGAVCAAVGVLSIGWAAGARPEVGDLAARADYFQTMFSSDRVFYAFIIDAGLYSVWQSMLLEGAEAKFRYIPFFGLAAYLISGGQQGVEEQA
ncbi:hypothetical protein FOA52_014367 [Chlamydomonas sp. UWO 241]|nr:hypothetical protein FOA52_014367 [Chlamydomonas sp. UWO 241]